MEYTVIGDSLIVINAKRGVIVRRWEEREEEEKEREGKWLH